MSERSHLSIGEVLSLLRQEFPDVTISKIRFLESQGLVDPERTPSGYRKFYDHDVERLRWILRQQREHFLPLKVIRGRLSDPGDEADELDLGGTVDAGAAEGGGQPGEEMAARAGPYPSSDDLPEPVPAEPGEAPEPAKVAAGISAGSSTADQNLGLGGEPATAAPTEKPPAGQPSQVAAAATPAGSRSSGEARPSRPVPPPTPVTPSLFTEARSDPGRAAAAQRPAPPGHKPAAPGRRGRHAADEPESYSADELAAVAGATGELVDELKQFGLVSAHAVVAGTPYFDECALAVTRAAAEFARYGVEVRHLRAWRNAADREAGLFEQIVLPLLRQRNPQARQHAAETLADLARLGGDLRSALLDQAIRQIR
jgi:DNA-binding transcriptional MerR regulator